MTEQTKLVPKRRFIEFQNTKAWEQHKLKDIADSIGTGKSTFVKNVYSTDNPYAILGSTSIIGYDSEFDYEGDFILTARVGENAGNLYRFSGKAKITDNTVFIKGENLEFLYPLFNHINLKKLSFGTGQPLIKASELKNIQLQIPAFQEKSKIGLFFRHLDDLILLQQRKLEKTKALKAAYLTEMFPAEGEVVPKRRFAGFTQAWEQRRIEDLAEVSTGKAFSSQDFSKEGKYLVVTNKNIQDEEKGIISVGDRIDISDNKILNNYVLSGNNILVTMDGVNIGKTGKYSDEKAVLAQRVGRLKSDQLDFVYQITSNNKFITEMNRISVGNAIKHISLSQISNYSFMAPVCIDEQAKIGNFFKQIDNIITLQQKKLEKLQNLKKAYLHEMFI